MRNPGNLERHADQGLQDAGIAQCARSRLSRGAEAGYVERTVGIAPERGRRDRRRTVYDPVRVRVAVEVQRGVIARELRVVEGIEGIHTEFSGYNATLNFNS